MKRRLFTATMLALVASIAVLAAATTGAAQATGTLSIVGPWKGADEQSFRAVLDGFKQQHPGVTVDYMAVSGSVADAVAKTDATKAPDVAVLSLPADLEAMRTMARSGTLQPIEFAVPAVRSNYAFAWKALGSDSGKLYGLFFKATNDSGFWFDNSQFRNQGLTAPTTWRGLQRLSDALNGNGRMPFAVSSRSEILLPSLFQNVYLMQQGNQRYDALARGAIKWSDGSVRSAMTAMRDVLVAPGRVAGGLGAGLETGYAGAVQKVFGSPQRAGMVAGGSAVLPVLYTAKAVRPITQFGVIPFPTINAIGAARVIGHANAVTMVEDTPDARALVSYLATPEAATIWAKRGGDFLSPNRKVDLMSYGVPAMRTLGTALRNASVFRFGLADLATPAFRTTLNRALTEYVRNPARLPQIVAQLDAAANKA